MATYAEAVAALESGGPVSRQDVRRWIASADLLTWSAVYALIETASSRIEPELPVEECADLVRRYLVRCIVENPLPGEMLHGGWQAAWLLAAHMKAWRRRGGTAGAAVEALRSELEQMYRRDDPALRSRILCGLLEHAFEEPSLRASFAHWDRDCELRDAYRLAMEWGRSKEQ